MLFRERGKKVYVIRTVYNKDKGRGEQVTVCKIVAASIPHLSVADDEIKDQLVAAEATPDEIAELRDWLEVTQKGKKESSDKVKTEVTLLHLTTVRNNLSDSDIAAHINEDLADKLFVEMRLIRDALRNAGHKEKRAKKNK